MHQRVIYKSLDSGFYEDRFPFKLKTSGGSTSFSSSLTRYNKPSEDLDCEPRRSKRARMFKGFGLDFHLYDLEEDPNTLQEALSHVDANFWQEAIDDEMESLQFNGTWHLVDLSPACKEIGCKWVLRKK